MSNYHFAVNAINRQPKSKYLVHKATLTFYDVAHGNLRDVEKQVLGQAGVRIHSCETTQELITHFKKYFPEQAVNIHVYDALFGKFYQLDANGHQTDIVDQGDNQQAGIKTQDLTKVIFDGFTMEQFLNYSIFNNQRYGNAFFDKAVSTSAEGKGRLTLHISEDPDKRERTDGKNLR